MLFIVMPTAMLAAAIGVSAWKLFGRMRGRTASRIHQSV
jgi:hypothetical protein